MALSGEVQSAAPGLLGFDTNSRVTLRVAGQFASQGFRFCIRYISRETERADDLSATEADAILGAGLALVPVQHVQRPPWQPTAQLGTQYGTSAAQNCQKIGFPPGIIVWCDLEGVATGTAATRVIDYCNAWYADVKNAGYVPGIYVGAGTILDNRQLSALNFQAYWRSQSNVPNVNRGYRLVQLFPSLARNGILIDVDVTQDDYRNEQVRWLARQAA